jgi:hypothetical protein
MSNYIDQVLAVWWWVCLVLGYLAARRSYEYKQAGMFRPVLVLVMAVLIWALTTLFSVSLYMSLSVVFGRLL